MIVDSSNIFVVEMVKWALLGALAALVLGGSQAVVIGAIVGAFGGVGLTLLKLLLDDYTKIAIDMIMSGIVRGAFLGTIGALIFEKDMTNIGLIGGALMGGGLAIRSLWRNIEAKPRFWLLIAYLGHPLLISIVTTLMNASLLMLILYAFNWLSWLTGAGALIVSFLVVGLSSPILATRACKMEAEKSFSLGKHDSAISLLKRAWRASPADHTIPAQIGHLCLILGRYAEAIRYTESAMHLVEDLLPSRFRGKIPAYYLNRGHAFRALGENARAIQDFRTYLELVPNAPDSSKVYSWIEELKQMSSDGTAAQTEVYHE